MSSLASATSLSQLHSLASCRGPWAPQSAAQNARLSPSLALVVQAASRGTSKAFANASAGQHIPLQRLAPVTGGGRPPLNGGSGGGGGGGSPSSSSSSSSVPRTGQDSLYGSSSGAAPAAPAGAAAAQGGASSNGAAAAPLARPGGSGSGSKQTQEDWLDLLQTPDADMLGSRARSASDAAVLRRKGHLKEQDKFIQFVLDMHQTHTSLEVMQKMERWIIEHRKDPRTSRLRRMVPSLGSFFVPLKLVDAFLEYDEFFALSRRQYVHPNFAELRHILNIAQVHSSAQYLKLITFDADGTLYADGHHIEHDNEMIRHIIALMRSNIHVAIVTAAGYPGAPERFEQRVEGLLAAFRQYNLPKHITDRFHIMGGECNYLLRVSGCPAKRLEFVPDAEWKGPLMMSWTEEQCQALLDSAERLLLEGAHRLRLPVEVIRKERACGVVPTAPTIYEVLEELAITVQNQLQSELPFCAFNGGNDVFVDVGNKSLGLEALMGHLGLAPAEVMHVGDRFSDTGNDSATRDCCSILWVANPEETDFFIKLLLTDIREMKKAPVYIE